MSRFDFGAVLSSVGLAAMLLLTVSAQAETQASFKQPYERPEDENNAAVVRQLQKLVGSESQLPAATESDSSQPLTATASAACVLDSKYACPADRDDAILATQLSLVGVHDAALLLGLLPLPATSIAAELTSWGANLGLKAVPPYLRQPLNRNVDPFPARDAGAYQADGCGIEFELLSTEASYTNLFGLVPLSDAYIGLSPFQIAPWYPALVGADETRWGFLRAPLLYHANSDVELSVGTPDEVSKWDQDLLEFGEAYAPIDAYADGSQNVYLPIGRHSIDWRSATQISPLFDVIVDGATAAVSIRSEINAIKGGVVASRRAAVVLSDEAASAALSPKSQKRFVRAKAKFVEYIKAAFKNSDGPVGKAILENAKKLAVETLRDEIIETLIEEGVECLDDERGIEAISGLPGLTVSNSKLLLAILGSVFEENYPAIGQGHCTPVTFARDKLEENWDDILPRILDSGETLIFALFSVDTTKSTKTQTITVFDSQPPVITLTGAPLELRATDFGGTRLSRSREMLLQLARDGSYDNCGRVPAITMAADEFLPLGENTVTFTFADIGPNPALAPGQPADYYAPTYAQLINVVDNEPPLMLVPQSIIRLSPASVPLTDLELGSPIAIDLVDVNPAVTNNIPDPGNFEFPAESRTAIVWTATDQSGNATDDTNKEFWQTVTVKETNAPPVAFTPPDTQAITAVPVDITLMAEDPDVVDGRRDPLWFKIEEQPEHGQFVAPLYPFFINDYRTRPSDGLDGYQPEEDVYEDYVKDTIQANYCDPQDGSSRRPAPLGFVHKPEFVQVDDAGNRFLMDQYFNCGTNGPEPATRISKWNAEGVFLGQRILGSNGEDIPEDYTMHLDHDGNIYYSTNSNTPENEVRINGCPVDDDAAWMNGGANCQSINYQFITPDPGEAQPVASGKLKYARIDSIRNLAYVYVEGSGDIKNGIWLYEFQRQDNGSSYGRFVGEVGPRDANGAIIPGWFSNIPTLVVGTDGSMYANDAERHRVHKFAPPSIDADGNLVPGGHIGWSGRCDSTTNNACDTDLHRSRGYSCTDLTCGVAANAPPEPPECSGDLRCGAEQGQFNTPRFIAIDQNNVLYVADYGNNRVQRFAADGAFAGEAKSTGTGVNNGDEPSFILGNMGPPASVAVNASQFFVIDKSEKFVHIFGALPFKNITDESVEVTYVSHQDFPNPLLMNDDSFAFSVSDGLEQSPPATAKITVSRNYRPPEDLGVVTAAEYGCPEVVWRSNESGCLRTELDEDTEMAFSFTSFDPDGIVGVDFLGLDTVSYSIVRLPRYGTISDAGDSWVYKPNPNFYGEDRLIFKANDGRDDSEPATLTFNVNNVNDAPIVDVEVPERTAVGFPTLATAVFSDDWSDEYWADVWWGDSSSDGTGEFVHEGEDAYIDGVAIIPPPQEGEEGRAVSDHIYSGPGLYTVRMCIEDTEPLQTCNTAVINVEALVSIAFDGEVSGELILIGDDPNDPDITPMEFADQFADGAEFSVEVTISNGEREGGGGLDAENMQFDMELPANLTVSNIIIEQGECVRTGLNVSCALGTLTPGQEVAFSLTAAGPGDLVYDEYRYFSATLSTSSDAINNDLTLDLTSVLIAKTTDSDGDGMSDAFEQEYGFNPALDDSAGDSDGDGLDNKTEYEEGTSPRNPDTDGDGIGDFAEVEAGSNPLADDNPPELVIPADIQVNSTGLLTSVNLGSATALDFKDGTVAPEANNVGPFAPGRNVVTWAVEDASGNESKGYQMVDVVPLLNFAVDQTVAEGVTASARVELNGAAVEYPVVVPYVISGSALNPNDHNAASGELLIERGLSGAININVVKDATAEPDESIVLTLGTLSNAVAGSNTVHTLTVSEQNAPPIVGISLEQQGRPTTTVLNSGGLTGVLSEVLDDPANDHSFDWSASDSGLFEPLTANDPAYLFDPQALPTGLYDLRLTVTDDGIPSLQTQASSLVKVVDQYPLLTVNEDVDGDGENDADEGTGDADGDRIPNYLDNTPFSNVLPIDEAGRQLETATGLTLRLGATTFMAGAGYAGTIEQAVLVDEANGYPSGVVDFELSGIQPGGTAQIVIPLLHPLASGAVYRHYAQAQWLEFDATGADDLASAAGEFGACPAPGSGSYASGLAQGRGCLQLTLSDGGANDSDGIADGVIRHVGGLSVPVATSAHSGNVKSANRRLSGAGDIAIVRFSLRSDSGDTVLKSLTLQASGKGDDTLIDNVMLVVDTNIDGALSSSDVVLATDKFALDNGTLVLTLAEPYEVPPGITELLIVYEVLAP